MIRFLLVITFVFLFLIFSIPMFLAEWLIGLKFPDVKSRSSLAIVKWAFRVVVFLSGTKVIVLGEENVPKDTPVLYIGNHQSYFDIILTYIRVPRLTGYISKKEMLRIPLLRQWMKNLHCLFLDRDNIKEGLKTILTAIDKIKNGISVCIFPEGTRNKEPGNLMPFHDGSFRIAEKGNVPVLPMTIINSSSIFEDHIPTIKKATVLIHYGEPVDLKTLDKETKKHVGEYFRTIISETYARDLEEYKDQLH